MQNATLLEVNKQYVSRNTYLGEFDCENASQVFTTVTHDSVRHIQGFPGLEMCVQILTGRQLTLRGIYILFFASLGLFGNFCAVPNFCGQKVTEFIIV